MIQHISNIYTLGKVCQLNLYIGIRYILPTIGEYMLVEFIYWYWIYSANNWGIYSDMGYILQQLADIFWYGIYSANNWEIYVNYWVFKNKIILDECSTVVEIDHARNLIDCLERKNE